MSKAASLEFMALVSIAVSTTFPRAAPRVCEPQVEVGSVAGVRFRRLFGAALEALEILVDVLGQHRHQPLPGTFDHHERLRILDPRRVALLGGKPSKEHVGGDHDDEPSRQTEQEAEGAVECSHAAVEDRIGYFDGDDRHHQKRAEEQDTYYGTGRDQIVIYVRFRHRHEALVEIKRHDGGGGPGN